MKIVLLIRSYNRPNYLKKTLKSLFKSDLTNINYIYIYDDKSNDKNTIKILKNIKKYNINNKNIKIIKGKKNFGVNKAYIYPLKILKSKYKKNTLIITIDNDIIMKKNWINILYNAYIKAEKFYNSKKILLTGFNCTNQHINTYKNKFYSKKNIYYRKNSIGGCNFVFHISFINFIINEWNYGTKLFKNKPFAADWAVINKMLKLNYPILCLNKSVVNHIGKKGTFSSPKKYNNDIYY
tara:strand:+ start:1193 stop:1906 length:714 start_codon:yes stop_codon:yes gene_type:complete